jgi:predicted dehydrogenase
LQKYQRGLEIIMSRTLNAAIIGAGRWGHVMLDGWTTHPDVNVVSIADLNVDLAKRAAEDYEVKAVYDDTEEMLKAENIDIVGIATPDFAHRDPVVTALEHGKHVLVQKPMATTISDCKAIVEAQKKSGSYLMVDFQHRWGIGYREAKKVVQGPTFGRPIHGRIRMSNQQSVPLEMLSWSGRSNVLWFIGTHTLDLLRHILQAEPVRVFAASARNVLREKGADTEDFFQSMIQFDNGTWIQMENSWVLPAGTSSTNETDMIIYGEHESIQVQQSPSSVVVRSTETDVMVPEDARAEITARHVSMKHFIESVKNGEAPIVDAHDGLMNTATLVAIEESARAGRVVEIEEVLK